MMVRSALMAVAMMMMMAGGAAAPAAGERPALGMLDRFEAGAWHLRLRDGGQIERLCLRNGRDFIQLRHPRVPCERFIVADDPNRVIVEYTCRGRGSGRTDIRLESGRIAHIESQGIADGLPFHFAAEARRVGNCRP